MVKLRKVATLAPVVLAASLVLTGCGEDEPAVGDVGEEEVLEEEPLEEEEVVEDE